MDELSLGVMARSRKENERRLAIHPRHIDRIDTDLRQRIYLERGYGERFGVPDEQLAGQVAGLCSRDQLVARCDVILLPKPLAEDLAEMRDGQVLWGWPHCVQNEDITQQAVDRRLTLIAFEAMNHWASDGSFRLHVFHKNNELAGYCSLFLWKTCRRNDPSLAQWFIASNAIRVSRRSTACWVMSSFWTQCGQPQRTWPSRISARSSASGLGSKTTSQSASS